MRSRTLSNHMDIPLYRMVIRNTVSSVSNSFHKPDRFHQDIFPPSLGYHPSYSPFSFASYNQIRSSFTFKFACHHEMSLSEFRTISHFSLVQTSWTFIPSSFGGTIRKAISDPHSHIGLLYLSNGVLGFFPYTCVERNISRSLSAKTC